MPNWWVDSIGRDNNVAVLQAACVVLYGNVVRRVLHVRGHRLLPNLRTESKVKHPQNQTTFPPRSILSRTNSLSDSSLYIIMNARDFRLNCVKASCGARKIATNQLFFLSVMPNPTASTEWSA